MTTTPSTAADPRDTPVGRFLTTLRRVAAGQVGREARPQGQLRAQAPVHAPTRAPEQALPGPRTVPLPFATDVERVRWPVSSRR